MPSEDRRAQSIKERMREITDEKVKTLREVVHSRRTASPASEKTPAQVTQEDRKAAAKCYAEFVGFETAVDEGDWMAGHFASYRETVERRDADRIASLEAEVAALREGLASFVGTLTGFGRNRDNMLSIDHEILRAIVADARAALTAATAPVEYSGYYEVVEDGDGN